MPPDRNMARKPSPAHPERPTGPMPWQDFVLGFEVANRALEYLDQPAVKPPFVQPVSRPARRDPSLWFANVMARYFGQDYPHLANFQHRFWALMQLLEGGFVDEWVMPRDEESPRRLHPALLLAAAEVRLTRNARFPPKRFAERVAEIIRTEVETPAAEQDGAG